MKAHASLKLLSIAILFALVIPVYAQEYDDMYFNHSDRKSEKGNTDLIAKNTEEMKQETVKNTDQYGTIQDNYSSKNVNPEYIARYRNSKDESNDPSTDGGSYYEENYNRDNSNSYAKQGGITNNYYNYPSAFYNGFDPMFRYNMYNNMMWDPMWGPSAMVPGWSFGMGYRFGYMPGWSFNLSYGNSWGYSPFGYSPMSYGYYDPWAWDSWNNPYSSYGGMGYGSWYYPSSYYYGSGFGNRYYGSVYNSCSCCYNNYNTSVSDKNVTYGRRSFRSSAVATGQQINNQGRTTRASANAQSMPKSGDANISQTRNRISSQRDYSAGQNEYYSRSRTANNPVKTSNSSNTDRSGYTGSSTESYKPGSVNRGYARTSSGTNDYSRPTYRSSKEGSSTYNNSNNSRSSYSRPSSSSWSSGNSSSGSSERSSRSYSSGSSSSGSSYSSGSSGSRSFSSGSSGGGSSTGGSSRGGRGH